MLRLLGEGFAVTPGLGKGEVGGGAEVGADVIQAVIGRQGGFAGVVGAECVGIDAEAQGATCRIQRGAGHHDGVRHDFGVAAIEEQGIGAEVNDGGNSVGDAFTTVQAWRLGRVLVVKGEGGPEGAIVRRQRMQGTDFGGAALGSGQPQVGIGSLPVNKRAGDGRGLRGVKQVGAAGAKWWWQ